MPGNKRSIPEIRARLHELAKELKLDELNDLADELVRNPPVKRGETKSQPLTPDLAQQIRDFYAAHPNLHEQDIANHFGVNPGRVSEALNNLI